ncbi:MAG: cell envelope biogenesis protein LolA [Rhizobiales bacterium]|nr:cell envelope biogenesis protein LolA [Hyphomicrobiales bacterium]
MVFRTSFFAALGLLTCVALPPIAPAQAQTQTQPTAPAVNAVGAGSGWQAEVQPGGVIGRTFSAEELKLIEDVNGYFNGIQHMNGKFVQTDAQQQRVRGRFFVSRPGRFRFVYSPPSKMVILSDGTYLSIEDHELETVERYSLSSTPFRILLAETVDVLRDAEIADIAMAPTGVNLTIIDKENASNGRLRLVFDRGADNALALREWVVTDAQGLDTRIEVAGLALGEPADPNLFKPSDVGLQNAHANQR